MKINKFNYRDKHGYCLASDLDVLELCENYKPDHVPGQCVHQAWQGTCLHKIIKGIADNQKSGGRTG